MKRNCPITNGKGFIISGIGFCVCARLAWPLAFNAHFIFRIWPCMNNAFCVAESCGVGCAAGAKRRARDAERMQPNWHLGSVRAGANENGPHCRSEDSDSTGGEIYAAGNQPAVINGRLRCGENEYIPHRFESGEKRRTAPFTEYVPSEHMPYFFLCSLRDCWFVQF